MGTIRVDTQIALCRVHLKAQHAHYGLICDRVHDERRRLVELAGNVNLHMMHCYYSFVDISQTQRRTLRSAVVVTVIQVLPKGNVRAYLNDTDRLESSLRGFFKRLIDQTAMYYGIT